MITDPKGPFEVGTPYLQPKWDKNIHHAPFNGIGGDLLSYPMTSYDYFEWRDVTNPVDLTLEIDTYGRGRSSALFFWRDVKTKAQYPMFISDMFSLLKSGRINGKVVSGTFKVIKKGANYGIQLVE